MTKFNRSRRRAHYGIISMVMTLLVLFSGVLGSVQAQTNSITGTVFRDFDFDGIRDTLTGDPEPGVGGVTVTVYGSTTNAPLGNTTTSRAALTLGDFTVTWSGDPDVRLEVTEAYNYMWPAAAPGSPTASNGTTTQFLSDGATVVVGLQNPAQYCDSTPTLATTCYVFGERDYLENDLNQEFTAVLELGYTSGSTTFPASGGSSGYTQRADAEAVGATWGMAHRRRDDNLFVGSFIKRHVGLGPTNNPGTIYRITGNLSGPGTIAPTFITLSAGANPHTTANPTTDPGNTGSHPALFDDLGAFASVGRVGLADVDLSEDENTLYAVNLSGATGSLAVINATGNTGSLITNVAIPAEPGCPGVSRPGGIEVHDGLVYVGTVCTGPSAADLDAAVFVFNGSGFSGPVINIDLDYGRGCLSRNNSVIPITCAPAEWQSWSDNQASFLTLSGVEHTYRPQPWLIDMEIDEYGFFILNLADRAGHQLGNSQAGTTGPEGTGPQEGVIAGDMLRLAPAGNFPFSSWTLESAGAVGATLPGGGSATSPLPRTPVEAQGPGGAEFYWADYYDSFQEIHDELFVGGTALVPGRREVVTSAMDPLTGAGAAGFRTGGFAYFSNDDGSRTRSVQLYEQDIIGSFGKAAGIGDIEALCAAAPIEIGNRIWFDDDRDGIQDPDLTIEFPLEGLRVELYDMSIPASPVLVGFVLTDVNGNYIFSSNPGSSGPGRGYNLPLDPNTTYEVRVDMTTTGPNGTILAGYDLTQTNRGGGGAGNDLRDSDAVQRGGTGTNEGTAVIVIPPASIPRAGANDHNEDLGFVLGLLLPEETPPPPPGEGGDPVQGGGPSITKSVDLPFSQPGDIVTWTVTVSNPSSITLTNVSMNDPVPAPLEVLGATASAGTVTTSGNTVNWSIDALQPGQSVTITIRSRVPSDAAVPYSITNTAFLNNGLQASATTLSVNALPATGETPLWRTVLLMTMMLGAGLAGVLTMLKLARKVPTG
jgi:uncharacterized repeat protein (TIGR01451 family)